MGSANLAYKQSDLTLRSVCRCVFITKEDPSLPRKILAFFSLVFCSIHLEYTSQQTWIQVVFVLKHLHQTWSTDVIKVVSLKCFDSSDLKLL